MKVSCPKCGRRFKVDDHRIPSAGMRMRCPQCTMAFRVSLDGSVEALSASTCPPPANIQGGERAGISSPAQPQKPGKSIRPPGGRGTELLPKKPILGLKPPSPPKGGGRTALGMPPAKLPPPTPGVSLKENRDESVDLPEPVSGDRDGGDRGFGIEIDLPGRPEGIRDSFDFGELDLPAPVASTETAGSPKIDLPAPVGGLRLSDPGEEIDLPGLRSSVRESSEFGEVDLPTPAGAIALSPGDSGEIDLPVPRSSVRESSEFEFGEVDFPAPAGEMDLPTPAEVGDMEDPFQEIGLHQPGGSKGAPSPLDTPPEESVGGKVAEEDALNLAPFGVGSDDGLISPADMVDVRGPRGSADLAEDLTPPPFGVGSDDGLISPADMVDVRGPRGSADLAEETLGRSQDDPFGSVDLSPSPDAGSPMDTLSKGDFDLVPPTSKGSVGLAGLGSPSFSEDSFGAVNLPESPPPRKAPESFGVADGGMTSASLGLQEEALPPLGLQEEALPPLGSQEGVLPPLGSTLGEGFASMGEDGKNPMNQIGEIDLAQEEPADFLGDSTEEKKSAGSLRFGEVDLAPFSSDASQDLGLPPLMSDASEEFDAFPTRSDTESTGDLFGSSGHEMQDGPLELDTTGVLEDQIPAGSEGADGGKKPAGMFSGRRKLERQSRNVKVVFLSFLVLVTAVGALLSYTPYGPFGAYLIYKMLPSTSSDMMVRQVDKVVTSQLKKDTESGFISALSEISSSLEELKDNEDLRLLGVFVHYLHQVRYGIDEKHDMEASKLLGAINYKESDSPYASLALGAQLIRTGKPGESVSLLASRQDDVNGLTLIASAHLASQSFDKALEAAKKLKKKENSARAGFLLARAQIASGLLEDAEKELADLVKRDSLHVDAYLRLTDVLQSKSPVDRERVVSLTQHVIDMKTGCNPSQKAQAHALFGRLYLTEHDIAKASVEFAKAEKLDGSNVLMLIGQGEVALKNDNASKAATMFSKVLSEEPDNFWAKIGRVEAVLRQGDISDAKKSLENLLKKYEKNARVHFLMGKTRDALKNYEEAEKEFRTSVELDKQYLEAYIALSQLYLKMDKDKDAMAILDAASEAVPGSPLINQTLADAHGDRGDYAAAIVELSKALDLDPDDARSHFRMGQMYRKMGSLEDAERSFDEVEKRVPTYPGLSLERGLLMELSGDVQNALLAYKKALAESPDDAVLKTRVAAASILVKDFAAAEKLLLDVQGGDSPSAEVNFYLGEVYRLTGRTAEAATMFKTAVAGDQANALYHLRYGMALKDARDIKQAGEEYRLAEKLDPKLAEVYVRIGEIQLAQGAARDAIGTVDKALALDPGIAEAYKIVAEAFEQLSDPRSAIAYYRRAVSAIPDNGELYFRLGLVELALHGNKRAIGPFAQAVSLGEKEEKKPRWLTEALYRLGVAQAERGMKSNAISTLEKYLKIAPEDDMDRSEVISNLEHLKY